MKFIKSIIVTPKRIFQSRKDRSAFSRSNPSSLNSSSTSTSASSSSSSLDSIHKNQGGCRTPTSVIEPQRSGEWSSDSSVSGYYSELLQAFKVIDKDNDGMVSRAELEALLSRLGAKPPSPEVVETMLSEVVVDDEDDDIISVEELTSRIGSACEPPAEYEELREVFLFFDTDRDGKITAEELLGFYTALGDERCTLEECRRMIAAVDKNGDGFVCFEDFSRMMDLQR